ncbi:SUMF1/EgtB/PvdO family nonheme iron enzyme [Leptolyngbya sp. PCC 6406]|uniref:SUMF1/EgtB/PvdO family nonheme iron enzyme n=1 Tax=Leptolyngbya sp. PCC 6406 TaxID=1173264 RepID=UPI0002AC8918|nr:SUMF1/EgtB/PvdO family nonheme iron enzyme [Leptolyngbya sp. PCC 6406]
MPDTDSSSLSSAEASAEATRQRRARRQQRTQTILRILGLPGGLGLAFAIHQLRSGQLGLALLTGLASFGVTIIALFAKFFSELGNKILDRIEERLEETTDSLAEWVVVQLESALVRLWWQITPQFRGAYYESLNYGYSAYKTQGLKTPDQVTPDLAKVFVPLRIAAKGLDQISPALIQRQETKGSLEVWDFLEQSQSEPTYRRMVIIGAPGSGKSTLLQHITLTYAHNTHRRRSRRIPTLVPVLLPLHAIRDQITAPEPPPLPRVIVAQIKTLPKGKGLQVSPQWFEAKLNQGQCLVMLDGLDEVPDEAQRRQVSNWVDQQMRAYPEARWILTSRPYGYRQAPLEEARITLGVQPFSLGQMEQFLQRWYLDTAVKGRGRDPGVEAEATVQAQDLIHRIKNYPPLAAMALNPLLLTMIATVHKNRGALPGNRVDLYDEIFDVLLVRRQSAKKLTEPFPLRAEQKKLVLQVLALALMEEERREFTQGQGVVIIADALASVAGDRVSPQDFLTHIETVSGLLLERESGVYQFAHLSFQEFLAAAQIKELGQAERLVTQVHQTWWHETIRLYAARSDTTALVTAALETPTLATLTIAFDCLEEGKSLAVAVRQRLEAMGLDSPDPAIAKLAAEVKLARRLTRLLRIDEAVQIDQSPLTWAEFNLFGRGHQPQPPGLTPPSLAQPAILSFEQALGFCQGLADWASHNQVAQLEGDLLAAAGQSTLYRLPTATELARVPAAEGQMSCWTLDSLPFGHGLRLVKETLPMEYGPLYRALLAQDWPQADQATTALLCPQASAATPGAAALAAVPGHRLHRIDRLWAQTTQGHQGWGVQASLWAGLTGPAAQKPQQLAQAVGWATAPAPPTPPPGYYPRQSFSAALLAKFIEGGADLNFPRQSFEAVTVDGQGQERQRQWHQVRCFVEPLGRGVNLEMVAIPPGEFWMGQTDEEKAELIRQVGEEIYQSWYARELPRHRVQLPGFWLGKYAITQAQWRAVAGLPKIKTELKPNPAKFKGDNRPVECVSWDEAVEFCDRLTRHSGHDYRLPSESEWEYACRASTETPFHFGETITTDLANYRGQDWEYKGTTYPGNYGQGPKGTYRKKTLDVGSFPPNAFGLYDMHGNVWEWCQDHWHGSYEGAPTDGSAWLSSDENKERLLRGGSWYYNPGFCRSAFRGWDSRDAQDNDIGFRVVCVSSWPLP